jgi:hemerythrin
MGFFGWFWKRPAPAPLYSVVNEDHVRLYQILGELRQTIGGRGDDAVSRAGKRKRMLGVVQRLIAECEDHFLREEALMVLHGFPGLAHHRAEHRALSRNVQGYASRLASGQAPITQDVSQFFKDWLTTHIRSTDRLLERFLFSACKDRDLHGEFAPGHVDMARFAAMVEQLRAARGAPERAG